MNGKRSLRTSFAAIILLTGVAGCGSTTQPSASDNQGHPAVFVAGTVSLPSLPGAVAVDPNSHKVYVATPDNNAIQIIDPATKSIVGTITSATHPVSLRIDPQRHRLYSVNYANPNGDGGSVELIDLNTEQITATVPVGDRPMLALDENANVAYSISKKDFGLSVIDPEQAIVLSATEVQHDERSGLSAMVVDPTNHNLYVTDLVAHTVVSVDPNTGTTTLVAEVGSQPNAMAVEPATHLLYTADTGSGRGVVTVVDPAAHRTVASIPVGDTPSAITIDSGAHLGYVANSDGLMSVIDLTTHKIAGKVQIEGPLAGIAVDTQTHSVYVTDIADNSLRALDSSAH